MPPRNTDTEAENPASKALDQLDPMGIVRLMNQQDRRVIDAVAAAATEIAAAIDAIETALRGGGRLFYVGAGTSGRLGALDAVECPPTFSTDPELVQAIVAGGEVAMTQSVEGAEDDAEDGARQLAERSVGPRDCVVGISASGGARFVLGALDHARAQGAVTLGICCNRGAPLAERSDTCIVLSVGAEVLAGSTRLKAGTATKMVLNMLSTGAMARVGKTLGNLMVDVRPTNAKLRLRARRLVVRIAGVDEEAAEKLLSTAGDEVKTAIVVHSLGLSPEAARERLARHGERLGDVLPPGFHSAGA